MPWVIFWLSHQAFAQSNVTQMFHKYQIMLHMSDYAMADISVESSGLCAKQSATNISLMSDSAHYT